MTVQTWHRCVRHTLYFKPSCVHLSSWLKWGSPKAVWSAPSIVVCMQSLSCVQWAQRYMYIPRCSWTCKGKIWQLTQYKVVSSLFCLKIILCKIFNAVLLTYSRWIFLAFCQISLSRTFFPAFLMLSSIKIHWSHTANLRRHNHVVTCLFMY